MNNDITRICTEAEDRLTVIIEAAQGATPRPWTVESEGSVCYGITAVGQKRDVVETDMGNYNPDITTARFICVSVEHSVSMATELREQLRTAWKGYQAGNDKDKAVGEKFIRRIAMSVGVV